MTEIEEKVCRLIRERPDYITILKQAIQVEENPPNDAVREFGWEWHDVHAHPAKLTKLVSEGLVKVTYKSRRYTHYRLVDKDAIKKALKSCLFTGKP
mgnify:CR=1 FL=1